MASGALCQAPLSTAGDADLGQARLFEAPKGGAVMPNWDRVCTSCGFLGSYLDFQPTSAMGPDQQRCERTPDCGATVEWEDDE
jgi:hypothetical protein